MQKVLSLLIFLVLANSLRSQELSEQIVTKEICKELIMELELDRKFAKKIYSQQFEVSQILFGAEKKSSDVFYQSKKSKNSFFNEFIKTAKINCKTMMSESRTRGDLALEIEQLKKNIPSIEDLYLIKTANIR